jgi:cytochrome c peroxidase
MRRVYAHTAFVCSALLFPTLLLCTQIAACTSDMGEQKTAYNWNLPAHFPSPLVPKENPISDAKVELGRYLFYDTRLSGNQTQACASCHQQSHAFAEASAVTVGSTGQAHHRNSLSLTNVAFNNAYTWAHGELTTLERQIIIPMFGENPIELNVSGHEKEVLERFNSNLKYLPLFNAAFPSDKSPINFNNIVKAIASFVRSLTSFNSPFDRYAYYAEDEALTPSQLRGLAIFMSEKTECRHCHSGFNFSQSTTHATTLTQKPYHNTGLYKPQIPPPNFDEGLFNVTFRQEDRGLFRAPTLRNLKYSAPYMHDGSIATLAEVIDFYAAGGRNIDKGTLQGDGRKHPNKSIFLHGFELTEEEKQDLLDFLSTLNDESFIANAAHAKPFN